MALGRFFGFCFSRSNARGLVTVLAFFIFFFGVPPVSSLNVALVPSAAWTNATVASLGFNVTDSGVNCSLWTNQSGTFSLQQSLSNVTNASTVFFSQNATEGLWLWTVSCTDGNAPVFSPENKTFGADFTPPFAAPVGVSGYNVSWSAPVDGLSGISRIDLYRNETLVFNTSNASRTFFLDAAANESYYLYRLRTTDAAGNFNESNVTYVPLLQLTNVSFSKVAPRFFNVTWQTDAAANSSLVWTATDNVSRNVTDAGFSTNHSGQVFTTLFGAFNVGLVSCRRTCLNQTLALNATPTINFTFLFYNATYQNQSAVFSATWQSMYGLNRLNLYSNNSGNLTLDFSSSYSSVPVQLSNVFFTLNATAREVDWLGNATDSLGEVVPFPLYRLLLSSDPNAPPVTPTPQPTPVPTPFVVPVVTAEPLDTPTPSDIPSPAAFPTPLVPSVTPVPGPEDLGDLAITLPSDVSSDTGSLTGFLSFSDVLQKPVSFNVTYLPKSSEAPVYLSVRVLDEKNGTAALVRSGAQRAIGTALFLQTPPVNLPMGNYLAEASVVADENGGRVLAASKYSFKLEGAAQDASSALLGIALIGALFVALFSVKISKHKKRLLE